MSYLELVSSRKDSELTSPLAPPVSVSYSDEDSNASKSGDEDDSMAVDDEAPKPAVAPAGPTDPNDLSAYNLDTYDEEESKGAGQLHFTLPA